MSNYMTGLSTGMALGSMNNRKCKCEKYETVVKEVVKHDIDFHNYGSAFAFLSIGIVIGYLLNELVKYLKRKK